MLLPDALVLWLIWSAVMGLGQFIYDFQALIGAGIAVGAAYWAGRPVYQQLKLTQTQTNGVLREMLLERQTELQQAQSAVAENLQRPLRDLGHTIGYDWEGECEKIDEHAAHHHDLGLSRAASWLRTEYHWRDSARVEAAKNALIEEIEALVSTLGDVHAPAHTDQVGEDYAMTDEEWQAFNARGEAAKDEVPGALADAQTALAEFVNRLEVEAAAISTQLRKVNEALVSRV